MFVSEMNINREREMKLKQTADMVELFNSATLNEHQTFEDKDFGILTVTDIMEWSFDAHNADSNELFRINSDGDFFSLGLGRQGW